MTNSQPKSKAVSAIGPDRQRLRVRTLVVMRWAAVLGQGAALVFVHFALNFDMAFIPAMMVVILAGVFNVGFSMTRPSSAWLSERGAVLSLAFDICQLGALLALTGGLHNPFVLLLLAPLAISAWSLSSRATGVIAALEILLVSGLGLWSLPLPWAPGGLNLPPLYLASVWVALIVAIVFTAIFVSSLSRENLRMADALSATQSALAREQRLAALGGLAAAAAHQLGTPLGTVTLVARELQKDMPPDHPWRSDIDLMVEESGRCREILSGLEQRPAEDDGAAYRQISLVALVQLAAEPYRDEAIEFRIQSFSANGEASPPAAELLVERHSEVIHGLGTLLQNAFQFAQSKIDVRLRCGADTISVAIEDDGPGFDTTQLSQLGEPFFSTGDQDRRPAVAGDHMGLGLFIARSLLGHQGADLSFSNRAGGGASVIVSWPIDQIESTISNAHD